jgi:hypothetical protein
MADSKPLIRYLPDVSPSDPAFTWADFARLLRIFAVEEGGAIDMLQGACGAFLSAAEHIVYFGAASVPIIHLKPAPLPPGATLDQQREYERRLKLFEEFMEVLRLLIRQFNASVPADFFSGVPIPAGQLVLTLEQKYAHMNVRYQIIPQALLDRRLAELAAPIGPQVPLANFLEEFRTYIRTVPVLSERECIKVAQSALAQRADLQGGFSDYFKANPHGQTFEGLVVELEKHEHLHLQLYGALHSSHCAVAADVPAPGSALAATAAPTVRRDHYCWSHGVDSNHASGGPNGCKSPFAGHQTAATKANKMGGATYRWNHLSREAQNEARQAAAKKHPKN